MFRSYAALLKGWTNKPGVIDRYAASTPGYLLSRLCRLSATRFFYGILYFLGKYITLQYN